MIIFLWRTICHGTDSCWGKIWEYNIKVNKICEKLFKSSLDGPDIGVPHFLEEPMWGQSIQILNPQYHSRIWMPRSQQVVVISTSWTSVMKLRTPRPNSSLWGPTEKPFTLSLRCLLNFLRCVSSSTCHVVARKRWILCHTLDEVRSVYLSMYDPTYRPSRVSFHFLVVDRTALHRLEITHVYF